MGSKRDNYNDNAGTMRSTNKGNHQRVLLDEDDDCLDVLIAGPLLKRPRATFSKASPEELASDTSTVAPSITHCGQIGEAPEIRTRATISKRMDPYSPSIKHIDITGLPRPTAAQLRFRKALDPALLDTMRGRICQLDCSIRSTVRGWDDHKTEGGRPADVRAGREVQNNSNGILAGDSESESFVKMQVYIDYLKLRDQAVMREEFRRRRMRR